MTRKKGFKEIPETLVSLSGDPYGTRTRVTGVRGL